MDGVKVAILVGAHAEPVRDELGTAGTRVTLSALRLVRERLRPSPWTRMTVSDAARVFDDACQVSAS